MVGLELLREKSVENFVTAEWAEKKRYYDTAVSRYYYCAYERIIYISKKEKFYVEPTKNEDSHVKTINQFISGMRAKLSPAEKTTLTKMKILRAHRNKADYGESKFEANYFMLGFKYNFKEIIHIINKFL